KGWIEPWIVQRDRGQWKLRKKLPSVEQVAIERLAKQFAIANFARQHAQQNIRLNADEPVMAIAVIKESIVRVETVLKQRGAALRGLLSPILLQAQRFCHLGKIIALAGDIGGKVWRNIGQQRIVGIKP